MVTASSPIIATMTSILTSVGVSAGTAATIASGVATGTALVTAGGAIYAGGKKIYDELKPSEGGGSNNNGSTPSTPQPTFPIVGPGGTNPNNANPETPATPNGGNNNANNGGGSTKIIIGVGIAAVLLLALSMNNSDAKPAKTNLSGLDGKKATKTKTINNLKF
jgi:hypothetical protein